MLETSGTITRQIGQEAGQVDWSSGGGFAAYGAPLTVSLTVINDTTLDDPDTADIDETVSEPVANGLITWASRSRGFNNSSLMFGSETANDRVELTNDIQLTYQ